jgi:hypothetical protein
MTSSADGVRPAVYIRYMAPRHDEIVKTTADGFTVAWDTTKGDDSRIKAVEKVVRAQADELGALVGADIVVAKGDQLTVTEVKKGASGRRSRVRRSGR